MFRDMTAFRVIEQEPAFYIFIGLSQRFRVSVQYRSRFLARRIYKEMNDLS